MGFCLLPAWSGDEDNILITADVQMRGDAYEVSIRGSVPDMPRAAFVKISLRSAMGESGEAAPFWETRVAVEKRGFTVVARLDRGSTLPGRYELTVMVESAGSGEERRAADIATRRTLVWMGTVKDRMSALGGQEEILSKNIGEVAGWIEEAVSIEKDKLPGRDEFNQKIQRKYQDLEGRPNREYFQKSYRALAQLVTFMPIPPVPEGGEAAKEFRGGYQGVNSSMIRKTPEDQRKDLEAVKDAMVRDVLMVAVYALDHVVGEVGTALKKKSPLDEAIWQKAKEELQFIADGLNHLEGSRYGSLRQKILGKEDGVVKLSGMALEIVERARVEPVDERIATFYSAFEDVTRKLR